VALAAPAGDPRDKYKVAAQLDENGDGEKAIAVIDEGLALAPRDLALLGLKGIVLLKLRDYSGALAAYQAYLDAGATGANRREAQKIVRDLSAVRSTFLDIALANGPATIYLDSKTQGVFCKAAPSCNRPQLPGDYKVIVERPGFERWTGRVAVESGKTAKLAVILVEKTSQLTVRATPAEAYVRVGDQDYTGPMTLAAGSHPVSVSLAGYAEARLEATAHEGKPIEIEVALAPLVAVRVEPPSATLRLDNDQAIALQDGSVVLPAGSHVVVGRAPGFHDRRIEIPAERPAGYRLEVVLERIAPTPPPPPEPGWLTRRRKLAIGSAGLGAAAIIVGAVLWDDGRRYNRYADMLCPASVDPCRNAAEAGDLRQRADRRSVGAYVGFGAGAVAAIAAAALWMTGAPESRVAVTPRVGPVAGLDLAVRF
jgi:hypothetical protein